MTLAEFFDRFTVGKKKRADFSKGLARFSNDTVSRVCDRMAAIRETLPALNAMINECDAIERAARKGVDETRMRLGRQIERRDNTREELVLFGLIRAFNRRGVLWDFVRGCWVTPNDPDYTATRDFDYTPCERCDPQEPIVVNGETREPPYRRMAPCAHCGPEPTLDGARAKWRALFPHEPLPSAFTSTAEALRVVERDAKRDLGLR